jgi:very-short-patch-repair endonuclease
MQLADQYRAWAEELVDLTAVNDLINFKPTKTTTIYPLDEAVDRLLKGESLLLSEISDFTDEVNSKASRSVIGKAKENFDQFGLKTLKLASGFASWNSDLLSNTNAPVLTYPLLIENPNSQFKNIKVSIESELPELNKVLLLHLKLRMGINIDNELIEEAEEEGPNEVIKIFKGLCPPELSLELEDGYAIKNLRYRNLSMVGDLLEAANSGLENDLISAIAGDSSAQQKLASKVVKVPKNEPDYVLPENEFLVLDADSSQQWAINSALKGQDLVIEGPPGTGKSQTIANLIASFMAQGKNVLFVAEKRAAIDAVKKRIDLVGLSDCFLDLHSADQFRKNPSEPFLEDLKALSSIPNIDCQVNQQDLSKSRQTLVTRSNEITELNEPWNCSYLDVVKFAIGSRGFVGEPFRINSSEVGQLKPDKFEDIKRSINEVFNLSGQQLLAPDFPLSTKIREGSIRSLTEVQTIRKASEVLQESLEVVLSWVSKTKVNTRDALDTPSKVKIVSDHIDEVNATEVVDIESPQIIHDEELRIVGRVLKKNLVFRWFSFITDKEYRELLSKVKKNISKGNKFSAINLRGSIKTLSSKNHLIDIGINPIRATRPEELTSCLQEIKKTTSTLNQYLNELVGMDSELSQIKDISDKLEAHRNKIPLAVSIGEELSLLSELGLSETGIKDQVINDLSIPSQDPENIYKKIISAWANDIEEELRLSKRSLTFDREYLDRTVNTFRESDETHISTTGKRIRALIADRAYEISQNFPQQAQKIRAEAARRRRRLPARKLFAAAPELLKSLKPCWAMNPLAVSQLLPRDEPYFDVVIFDEASQIETVQGISAILRGKQTIVAGDSKQLSPTQSSFFASSDDSADSAALNSEEEEDAFNAAKETESLLEAVKIALPPVIGTKTLQWHYRSEDERLIAFSNKHQNLYNSKLITAPSTSTEAPFGFHQVEGSINEITGKSPKGEVKKTVELVIDHLTNKPNQSLAVIAFGSVHARNIEKQFYKVIGENSDIRLAPDDRPEEKFIIRHLETIQGDERDAIILATGYGPKAIGKLRNDFGVLNRSENEFGLRRLNVAITRARKRVDVVTTIKPYEYDDNQLTNVGAKGLIQYLRFVQSGGSDLGDLAVNKIPMNEFEQDIFDALTSKGVGLVPQYGVSGYRLDFAVQHPDEKGRFVLALEADGASYHSSDTARDRDRIRQNHLERLGWKFHRIWSTDWFLNKEQELELAVMNIEQAIRSGKLVNPPQKS